MTVNGDQAGHKEEAHRELPKNLNSYHGKISPKEKTYPIYMNYNVITFSHPSIQFSISKVFTLKWASNYTHCHIHTGSSSRNNEFMMATRAEITNKQNDQVNKASVGSFRPRNHICTASAADP